MDRDVTYIGMDLGTFKTSVASSYGKRDALHSAVGWPKDRIAQAALGQAVSNGIPMLCFGRGKHALPPWPQRGASPLASCAVTSGAYTPISGRALPNRAAWYTAATTSHVGNCERVWR